MLFLNLYIFTQIFSKCTEGQVNPDIMLRFESYRKYHKVSDRTENIRDKIKMFDRKKTKPGRPVIAAHPTGEEEIQYRPGA